MTVADLIVELEKLQQDDEVYLWCGGDYGRYPVKTVGVAPTKEPDTVTLELI